MCGTCCVHSQLAAEAPPDTGSAHEDTERGRYTLKGKKLHLRSDFVLSSPDLPKDCQNLGNGHLVSAVRGQILAFILPTPLHFPNSNRKPRNSDEKQSDRRGILEDEIPEITSEEKGSSKCYLFISNLKEVSNEHKRKMPLD